MFVKIISKIHEDCNSYYVNVVSPETPHVQIATADCELSEGMTYRATPKIHWVMIDDFDSELAHFKIYGKQTPMEKTA